jgi:hypothetical protein
VSSRVVVSGEAWQFLLSKVADFTRPPTERDTFVSRRVLEPGLLLKAHRAHLCSTMLRFETEDDLRALSSVLGEMVTTDVRKRRSKCSAVESLFVNNIINVVAGSESREEPFQSRTTKQGIDMVYNGTNVRIRMRHQRHQCTLPLAEGGPSNILTRAMLRKGLLRPGGDASSDDDSDDDGDDNGMSLPDANAAVVGRQFENLGRVCAVNAAGPTTVSAKVVWPGCLSEMSTNSNSTTCSV